MTFLLIFLIIIGLLLVVASFIISMPSIFVFIISVGGGLLIGIGIANLYLDWRLRRKRNKQFIPYRKKGE